MADTPTYISKIAKMDAAMIPAFQYAYGLGITDQCPLHKANLDGAIKRIELAKFVSEFATKVLGKEPDIEMNCPFTDMRKTDMRKKTYGRIACQLKLMGLHADGKAAKETFDPEEYVTREQFATIFSRLLYGDTYNLKPSDA